MEPGRPMIRRPVPHGQLAVVALLTFGAAMLWARVFDTADLVVPLGVTVLATFGVSLACHWRSTPHTAVSTLAAVGALAVSLVATTGGLAPGVWRDGLAHGWSDVLSAAVPAPSDPVMIVFPVVLTWAASFLAAELTIRVRPPLAPVAPAVVLGCVAYLFALDAPGRNRWEPLTLSALVGVLLLLRRRGVAMPAALDVEEGLADGKSLIVSPDSVRRRQILGALPLVAVLAAVAVLVGGAMPWFSSDSPLQLRDHWETRDRLAPTHNPLGEVGRAARSADPTAAPEDRPRKVFDVRLSRPFEPNDPPRFRVVVLDRFDQLEWTAAPRFVAVGSKVPTLGDSATDGRSVEVVQTIRMADGGGSWVPVMGRPVRLDAPLALGLKVDTETGVMIRRGGSATPVSYEVTARVPAVDFDEIATTASVGTTEDAFAALDVPDEIPTRLQTIATELSSGTASLWQQLAKLIAFFDPTKGIAIGGEVVPFALDPNTNLGHSLGSLSLFTTPPPDGVPAGTSEQIATTFVVLARLMKIPARVVVGYVPPVADEGRRELPVMSNDLQAWPEVNLAGHGWVPIPFDLSAGAEQPEVTPEVETAISEAVTPPDVTVPPVLPPKPCPPDCPPPPAEGRPWWVTVLLVVAVLALVAFVVSTPAIVKGVTRRRRARRGDPVDRIAGAWHEAMDRLTEAGAGDVRHLVPTEAADRSEELFGPDSPDALIDLGVVWQRAMHAAAEPTADDAELAWSLESEFEASVREARTWRERTTAALDPRPILRAGR